MRPQFVRCANALRLTQCSHHQKYDERRNATKCQHAANQHRQHQHHQQHRTRRCKTVECFLIALRLRHERLASGSQRLDHIRACLIRDPARTGLSGGVHQFRDRIQRLAKVFIRSHITRIDPILQSSQHLERAIPSSQSDQQRGGRQFRARLINRGQRLHLPPHCR